MCRNECVRTCDRPLDYTLYLAALTRVGDILSIDKKIVKIAVFFLDLAVSVLDFVFDQKYSAPSCYGCVNDAQQGIEARGCTVDPNRPSYHLALQKVW